MAVRLVHMCFVAWASSIQVCRLAGCRVYSMLGVVVRRWQGCSRLQPRRVEAERVDWEILNGPSCNSGRRNLKTSGHDAWRAHAPAWESSALTASSLSAADVCSTTNAVALDLLYQHTAADHCIMLLW